MLWGRLFFGRGFGASFFGAFFRHDHVFYERGDILECYRLFGRVNDGFDFCLQ
jgi:hypothetical protein